MWSSTAPRSMARPTTPCSNTGSNIPGKMVMTSNRISSGVLHLEEPVGDGHAAGLQVDLEHRIARRGDEELHRASPGDPDVVRGALEHLVNRAHGRARRRSHVEADQLVVI